MRRTSKTAKRGGKATKGNVDATDTIVTQATVRGKTYATEGELRTATLKACRREMLDRALHAGAAPSKVERDLDLDVEAAKRFISSIRNFNRMSSALRKVRDGLRELVQLDDLTTPLNRDMQQLAARLHRIVDPVLLADLERAHLVNLVGATRLLYLVEAYERRGWGDSRAITCLVILAGYWPSLAASKPTEVRVAQVVQTVREAVKFQQSKIRRMQEADARYVAPKFRIIGTK